MAFDSSQGAPWGTEKKVSKLIFIGVNLVKDQFEKEIRACLSQN